MVETIFGETAKWLVSLIWGADAMACSEPEAEDTWQRIVTFVDAPLTSSSADG
ncbi:hypothetical protein [Mycobacterium sp.]|uniref:hypothetical protein n=1 Tax=Mycobacterium sp. TaxID=1785 RepID=UPI00262A39BC|nr:hypothetical protein [Mycobacterium sp.]